MVKSWKLQIQESYLHPIFSKCKIFVKIYKFFFKLQYSLHTVMIQLILCTSFKKYQLYSKKKKKSQRMHINMKYKKFRTIQYLLYAIYDMLVFVTLLKIHLLLSLKNHGPTSPLETCPFKCKIFVKIYKFFSK